MLAFLRKVSPHLSRCELTHRTRVAIDSQVAADEHAAFAAILRKLGLQVEFAPDLPDHPDGVFIEDAAVLLPEVAIVTRPGAASRMAETESIIPLVSRHRPLQRIVAPGSLDGGDVLRIGRTLFVGESSRTNAEGIDNLRAVVEPFGYETRPLPVRECVRLKSACTFVPPHFVVHNPQWIDPGVFGSVTSIPVSEKEPLAANTLTVNGTTLVSASYPKTEKRLREAGIKTQSVDISEMEKAEGGLTCLALIVEPRAVRRPSSDSGMRVVQVPGLPQSEGHGSQAIVHGGLVYVAPQFPFSPGAKPPKQPLQEQAENVMRHLSAVLDAAESALCHTVRVTVYLADAKQWEHVEPVYARAMDAHRPVRAVVENSGLPRGVLISIEAVAAIAGKPVTGIR